MLEINKIYHSDCLELLPLVGDGAATLAVIDPPYNLKKAEWDTFPSHEEFLQFTYRWLDELLPKLSLNGSLYVFNTPFNAAYILGYLAARRMHFQNWITWDKRDGLSAPKRKYGHGQETILFFTKSNQHVFNHDAIRVPYDSTERIRHATKKGILKNGKRWFPNPEGKICGEVWHFASERHQQKINGKTQKLPHITPKPLALVERIIKASSREGDLVLDCFVGSGTTALAAKKLNRNFICGDKSVEYVKLANDSLEQI